MAYVLLVALCGGEPSRRLFLYECELEDLADVQPNSTYKINATLSRCAEKRT